MEQKRKKLFVAVFTLTGTLIGAGILGLPYIFAQSGFIVGLFWLLFLGGITLYINLCLGEISLRTKNFHQLPGYAERYLGKWGKRIMLFGVAFGVYAALLAYLIGEGQSLSLLFFGHTHYAVLFAVGFWMFMTFLLTDGIRGLGRLELLGVVAIIGIVFFMFGWYSPQIDVGNLSTYHLTNFFVPFGIVLFALLGFSSIPELRMEVKNHENVLKKSIIIGTILPVILYIIFTVIFNGVLGQQVSQISTLSFGNLIVILGIFTILTSYFVLSFSLRDIFLCDLMEEKLSFVFVSLIPLVVYLFVTYFHIDNFVEILGIGGVVSGGVTGILVLLMGIKAKKLGKRKPEFTVPINWPIIIILSIILIFGVFTELL